MPIRYIWYKVLHTHIDIVAHGPLTTDWLFTRIFTVRSQPTQTNYRSDRTQPKLFTVKSRSNQTIYRQIAVKPGGPDASAVHLYTNAQEPALAHVALGLELGAWRVWSGSMQGEELP